MTPSDDKHPWIELAAALPGGGMKRNQWVLVDDAAALLACRKKHGNRDVYRTVCQFAAPDRSSSYACPGFFADVDATDLEQARQDALKVCELLMTHLGIAPGSMDLFFSGAKGFHILVASVVFGEPGAPNILEISRALARRLAKAGVSHIDLGIYQPARVLRLPNSINTKTGLFKIPIEHQELKHFGLQYVLDLARSPRECDSMAVPEESPKAVGWFQAAVKWQEKRAARRAAPSRTERGFRNGWRVPPCIRNLKAATLPDGIRHEAYFVLARFYARIDMHPDEVAERLHAIDARNPIRDPGYIARVVRGARKYPGFPKCDHPVMARYCDRARCFLAGTVRQAVRE